MFRRPKKTIRPRVVTFGECGEDEEEVQDMETEQMDVAPKKEEKVKSKPKQATLLSFDQEEETEETEVFRVKKSSVSRKLIKQRGKEKSKVSSSAIASGFVKKEDSGRVVDLPSSTNIDTKSSGTNTGIDRILTGREAEAVDLEEEDEDDEPSVRFRRPARSDVSEAVRLTLERAQIPDANLIHEAKKRRQMAREMHVGPGGMPSVIPLKESQPKHRLEGSRFIRDDDDDKSDEDERIDFSNATNAEKLDREKRAEAFNAAADEDRDLLSDNDSDVEIDEWEQQQIRKGIKKTYIQQIVLEQENLQSEFTPTVISIPDDTVTMTNENMVTKQNINVVSQAISIDDIISGKNKVTSEAILRKLSERMENLKLAHDRNVGELSRLSAELELVISETEEVEKVKPQLSSRFMLYQKLRGYVADLVDCYRCKIPPITAIEKRLIEIMKARATRIVERRRKDTADQVEEINNSLRSIGINSAQQFNNAEEVRVKRAAEREGRRTRRRRTRELRNVRNHKDGLSSDDEETELEINAYRSQLEALFSEASQIFEDVSEDFSEIEKILDFFLEWRTADFDSYKESYAFMCVCKCISPLVRLEILQWDPLVDDFDFKQFPWMNVLVRYNYKKGESFRDVCTNLDSKTIPSVAEKVVVPWIEVVVRAKWDPTSASQTRRLVNIVKKLIVEWYVAPNSKSVRSLLSTIIVKFKDALENDVYIPIFPSSALANKCSPASVFASRQFWSGVKLLDNMAGWAGILSDEVLHVLALDALLTRYLLLGIRTATDLAESVERANGIVNVIPTVWIPKDQEQPNGIQQLIHCLISMVQNADCLLAVNKFAVQEIAKILKGLGATSESEMILGKYS